MRYYCYIKSHCEAPDWEQECEARSKKEACRIFAKMASGCFSVGEETYCEDWSAEDIAPHVESEASMNRYWHNAQVNYAKKGVRI